MRLILFTFVIITCVVYFGTGIALPASLHHGEYGVADYLSCPADAYHDHICRNAAGSYTSYYTHPETKPTLPDNTYSARNVYASRMDYEALLTQDSAGQSEAVPYVGAETAQSQFHMPGMVYAGMVHADTDLISKLNATCEFLENLSFQSMVRAFFTGFGGPAIFLILCAVTLSGIGFLERSIHMIGLSFFLMVIAIL